MTLKPGTRLGPYEIFSLLPLAGLGEIYRGRDHDDERDVTIRVLRFATDADPALLPRLAADVLESAVLTHPSIPKIYDVGTTTDTVFIVSEPFDGETLRALVDRGELAIDVATACIAQVAGALAVASKKGMSHGDLRAENVLLTPERRTVVLGFGLAAATGGDASPDQVAFEALCHDMLPEGPPVSGAPRWWRRPAVAVAVGLLVLAVGIAVAVTLTVQQRDRQGAQASRTAADDAVTLNGAASNEFAPPPAQAAEGGVVDETLVPIDEAAVAEVEAASEAAAESLESASEAAAEPLEAALEAVAEPLESASEAAAEPLESASEAATEPLESASEAAAEPLESALEAVTEPLEAESEVVAEALEGVSDAVTEPLEVASAGEEVDGSDPQPALGDLQGAEVDEPLLVAGDGAAATLPLPEVSANAAPPAPVPGTDGRDARSLIAEALVRSAEFDLPGAMELLRVAAERGDAGSEVGLIYLRGLVDARDAFRDGGTVAALAPVHGAIEALAALSQGRRGSAEIARLVLQAAAAAAQNERGEMRLYLETAMQMEVIQSAAGLPGAPLVSATEIAGDLWLQVDRYEDARQVYADAADRVGPSLRIMVGSARASSRLKEVLAACTSYGALLETWGTRPGQPAEIAEAQTYIEDVCASADLPGADAPA